MEGLRALLCLWATILSPFLRLAGGELSTSYDCCLLRPIETCFKSWISLTEPSPKEGMESTKAAGHLSIDSTTYYTITLPPRRSIYTILPFTAHCPILPSSARPMFPFPPHHIPWPPPYGFSPAPPPLTLRRSVQFQTTGSNCANIVKRYLPGSRVLLQSRKEGNE